MVTAKTTWGIGDYPGMAARLEPVAEQAVELADVHAGVRVLDVGCGTGTFARAAAQRGAEVVGVDVEPVLLEIARSLDTHDVQWRESDFGALDAEDDHFEIVASLFGVMYASDHHAAAVELARVCADDGVVVLSAWTPSSFMPAFGRAVGPYLAAPALSSGPPSSWGNETTLESILSGAALTLDVVDTRVAHLSFDGLEHATDFVLQTAGHVLHEQDRLRSSGDWEQLRTATLGVVRDFASSTNDGVLLALEYLMARARPS